MKNIYKNIMFRQSVSLWIISLLVVLFANVSVAQVHKPFQQRTSSQAPVDFRDKQIYNLRGDFKMIGNTNLRVSGGSGANSESNSNTSMALVDEDGVAATANSSSAELVLPATCTNIVYAGLYWSGRRNNNSNATTTSTNNYSTGEANIQSSGLGLTITSTGTNTSGTIIYTLSNSNNSIYYQYELDIVNDVVRVKTSSSGAFVTIPSSEISAANSGNATSGTRTITFLQPITFTTGNYTFIINNLQRRRGSPVTNLSNRNVNITVITNNGASSNKIKAKIRKGTGAYTDLVADDYYIGGSSQDGIFTAYKDVTNYVQNNGAGNYWVADLDLNAGNGSSVGYFGGWGMVIIYENPTMKWRDITVFDGYAYVSGGASYELPLSGFNAAQNGAVNVTMGMMAGEGDRSISGDAFRIRNAANTSWEDLSHSGNTISNFFNSSILTDGSRTPNLVNNTGLDIVKFNLDNASNSLIANNQTSTRFQYANNGGGGQDTYVIYNIVFAVDAYVPEAEGVNLPSQIQPLTGLAITDPVAIATRMQNLQPGDEVTMNLDIYNYGNEAIKDGVININVPNSMRYIGGVVTNTPNANDHSTSSVNYLSPVWIDPTTSNVGTVDKDGGIIRWTLGTIPTQVLPTQTTTRVKLSRLAYTLKVTTDCTKLISSENECMLSPIITGAILGKGVNSNADLDPRFIVGYNVDCSSTPIYGNTSLLIKPSAAFLADCSEQLPMQNGAVLFKKFCQATNNVISRAEIMGVNNENYPAGTIFYSEIPTESNPTIVSGDFPVNTNGSLTYYYAVAPGSNTACYLKLATQLEIITTQPTTNNVVVCEGEVITLNNIPSATFTLYYFQNENDSTPMLNPPAPTAPGTYTYWVADGQTSGTTNCFGPKKSFTITINPKPAAAVLTEQEICAGTNYTSSLTTISGITKVWEYQLGNGSWVTLSNQLPGVSVVNNQLNIIGAQLALNDTKFRVKYTSTTTTCVNYSNEMVLKIKGCSMKVNPQIYNKFKQP